MAGVNQRVATSRPQPKAFQLHVPTSTAKFQDTIVSKGKAEWSEFYCFFRNSAQRRCHDCNGSMIFERRAQLQSNTD
jgi:hypothetical protein